MNDSTVLGKLASRKLWFAIAVCALTLMAMSLGLLAADVGVAVIGKVAGFYLVAQGAVDLGEKIGLGGWLGKIISGILNKTKDDDKE